MEQARELLNQYYNKSEIFYDTAEIETKIIQISLELSESFTIKQKMLFDSLNTLLEKKKAKDDIHLIDFLLSIVSQK